MSIDVDKYILRAFWLLSLVVTIGVLSKCAPVLPVLPFVPYSLTVVGVTVGTYLIALLGELSYLTAKNRNIDTALETPGYLEKFLHALAEPIAWGQMALLTTSAYFISTHYSYVQVIEVTLVLSLSTVLTAAFAILRNLHMVKLFSSAALKERVLHSHLKEAFIHDLLARIDEEEDAPSSNPNDDTTVH